MPPGGKSIAAGSAVWRRERVVEVRKSFKFRPERLPLSITLHPIIRGMLDMEGRRVRLGDDIDDYCARCRLIMNHGVVGMVGDAVKKVRCQTCKFEHDYRRGQLPSRRKTATQKLFDEVLKGARPVETAEPEAPPAPPVYAPRKLYTIRRTIGGKAPVPPRKPQRR